MMGNELHRSDQAVNDVHINELGDDHTEMKEQNRQIEHNDRSDGKIALVRREENIKNLEQTVKSLQISLVKKEADLNDRQMRLEELELQAKNGFPKLFEERFAVLVKQIEEREGRCVQEWNSIEAEKGKLRVRELEVQKAEITRNQGYNEERKKFDAELLSKRNKYEQELEEERKKRLDMLNLELLNERKNKLAVLENEIAEKRKIADNTINTDLASLEKQKLDFAHKQAMLVQQVEDIDYNKRLMERRKESLEEREIRLDNEVESKVEERKKSFEHDISMMKDECSRLRESIKTSNELVSNFEELKRKLGGEDPAAVLLKLKTYEEEINDMRLQLTTRPTQEMQVAFDRIKSEKTDIEQACARLSEENEILRRTARQQSELEMQIITLTDQNKSLTRRFESIDADNTRLSEDLRRLQASYAREEDREKRILDIETPYFQKDIPRSNDNLDELNWLDGIGISCCDYGLKFPRRILHAFHTALKTAEWSPITVLAGVSGTGKSELPRLYSHFGGINFLSLSVQPNWDSQESMLGFFNSIDNKFDAQPVLRLLAQSQKKRTENYPYGFEDVMSLILMDEMNLAHVELYFAEFLSKLELRRGRKGNEVPWLEVKLGAGIQHYNLPLGRNVLWTGTMNQDETTKSLSDKVLDRGIVINFPRPVTLERRKQLKALIEQSPLLSRKRWESWWCKESSFSDDQIMPYKGFIEGMNTSLSKVGRALGHRVWQSIEYYMSNYPDVMESLRTQDDKKLDKAMKVAFEDQLVQKVMPKLRGIETRGKSKTDCLDKIRARLVDGNYSIIEDFDLACEFGYGQFIWNSANYLKDDGLAESESEENVVDFVEGGSSTENIPDRLIGYAQDERKELWSLTTKEIMDILGCDVRQAKELKEKVNQTKDR